MTGTMIAPQPELTPEQRAFSEIGALRVEVSVSESDYAIEIIAPDKPGVAYALDVEELWPVLAGDLSRQVGTGPCLS